jgi:hypothetical protein
MSEFDHDLELELRTAAPQARPLFVDEVARRLHAQRPGLRPSRFRLFLALAFSVLTAVALGVLGAPAYVAHAGQRAPADREVQRWQLGKARGDQRLLPVRGKTSGRTGPATRARRRPS